MKQPSRHAHAISRELTDLLDWYYEQSADPQVSTEASRLASGCCDHCGAGVGRAHKVGCPYYPKVYVGRVSHGNPVPGEDPALLRMAAIGVALGRLSMAEGDAVRVAWAFRRGREWWHGAALNSRLSASRINRYLPEYADVCMTNRERRAVRDYYRREWDRAKRLPACKSALGKLEAARREGRVW